MKMFGNKKKQYAQENKDWLAVKAEEEGVQSLPGGVYYKVLTKGEGGNHPTPNDVVVAHYTGMTIDGKTFDSSRGGTPLACRLRDLISGWVIAMQWMRPGDRWEIYIPAELGYGKLSQPGIPANSTLIFDVELISVH